jgi:hyperosmotically inducible protein
MKRKLAATYLVLGVALAPMAIYAADSDTDRNKPGAFVKDSVITTKIKSKLAAEHPASVKNIQVDTDKDGTVWMSGTAPSQAEINQAIAIARNTEGVRSVKNELKVQKER